MVATWLQALLLALPLALSHVGSARGQDTAPARAVDRSPVPSHTGPTDLRFEIAPADSGVAPNLVRYAREGAFRVATFFGRPFPRPVHVRVFPDREGFDRYLTEEWGMTEPACWMVGGAEEEALVLLSPRVWREEACDHDPDSADHVRDLVAHELVHVYHMQVNPSDAFAGVEGLDWFVEGVATLVSGQYERVHAARAREAIEKDEGPTTLDDAWTGPYRYGVAGSLASFVGERIGPDGLAALLEARTREEVLGMVGLTEEELLEAWRDRVRRGGTGS